MNLNPDQLASPAVLLGVLVSLIIFGGLIPRWLFSQMINLKDETIERQAKTIERQADQIDRLIGSTETSVRVAEAVGQVAIEEVD